LSCWDIDRANVDRWILHLLHELAVEAQRTQSLMAGLKGYQLADALGEAEGTRGWGWITRTVYAEAPPRVEYGLTDRGRGLLPIMAAFSQVGGTLYTGSGAECANCQRLGSNESGGTQPRPEPRPEPEPVNAQKAGGLILVESPPSDGSIPWWTMVVCCMIRSPARGGDDLVIRPDWAGDSAVVVRRDLAAGHPGQERPRMLRFGPSPRNGPSQVNQRLHRPSLTHPPRSRPCRPGELERGSKSDGRQPSITGRSLLTEPR